jgi:hypothetical protein
MSTSRKTRISAAIAAAAAASIITLAGCGSAASTKASQSGTGQPVPGPASSSLAARAAFAPDRLDRTKVNPVALVKLAGATTQAGEVNGEWVADGSGLVADGDYYGPPGSADDGVATDRADGEQLTVYTFTDQAARDAWTATYRPDDSHAFILGSGQGRWFLVELTGMAGGPPFGGIYGPHPAEVARRLGGTLVPGSPQ